MTNNKNNLETLELLNPHILLSQLSRLAYEPPKMFFNSLKYVDFDQKIPDNIYNYRTELSPEAVKKVETFNQNLAKEAKNHSYLVSPDEYTHGTINSDKNKTNNIIGYYFTNKHGNHCYIFSYDNNIYVTFRGSMSWTNWMNNAKIKLLPITTQILKNNMSGKSCSILEGVEGKFFQGFMVGLLQLVDRILYAINLLNINNDKNIYITGHSLGGALATLCGFYLGKASLQNKIKKSKIKIVTFGAPIVGDCKLSDEIKVLINNETIYLDRVYNKFDPVTMDVNKIPGFKHVHVGHNKFYQCNIKDKGYVNLKTADITLFKDEPWFKKLNKNMLAHGYYMDVSYIGVVNKYLYKEVKLKKDCEITCGMYNGQIYRQDYQYSQVMNQSIKNFMTNIYNKRKNIQNNISTETSGQTRNKVAEKKSEISANINPGFDTKPKQEASKELCNII